MPFQHERESTKVAKDLAEGVSAQAKYSNRVWLALIAASTLAIFRSCLSLIVAGQALPPAFEP